MFFYCNSSNAPRVLPFTRRIMEQFRPTVKYGESHPVQVHKYFPSLAKSGKKSESNRHRLGPLIAEKKDCSAEKTVKEEFQRHRNFQPLHKKIPSRGRTLGTGGETRPNQTTAQPRFRESPVELWSRHRSPMRRRCASYRTSSYMRRPASSTKCSTMCGSSSRMILC